MSPIVPITEVEQLQGLADGTIIEEVEPIS
jgi:hypothetical protein